MARKIMTPEEREKHLRKVEREYRKKGYAEMGFTLPFANTVQRRFLKQSTAKEEVSAMASYAEWVREETDRGPRLVKRIILVLEKPV